MVRFRQWAHGEEGVALLTVMMSVFILTVVVGAMAIATMGESALSFDQLRGQQALAVSEAGAYRALAELRHRLSEDLDAQIGQPTVQENDLRNICEDRGGRRRVELLTDYAYPTSLPGSDWTLVSDTAVLAIGTTASPIAMTDAGTGAVIGTFDATIYIRASGSSTPDPPGPADCSAPGPTLIQRFVVWYDYAIVSTGRVGSAVRTVCLRSPGADRCADWLPSAPAGAWSGSGVGWPVLIEKASYSQWAIMVLETGSVWFYDGAIFKGRVHSNTRLRVNGRPIFDDVVTQFDDSMHFRNCGAETDIRIDPALGDPNAYLQTLGCDDPQFNSRVTAGVFHQPPSGAANPARAAVGLVPPAGVDPNDPQIRGATSDDPYGPGPLQNGLYVIDQCGGPGCGGIYVRGDVQQMVLQSEAGRQVIYVTVGSSWDPDRRDMKIIIDPATRSIQTCAVFIGPDPGLGDCTGWSALPQHRRSYPDGTFNGVFYVDGAITSDPDPAVSSGLYGVLNRNMRLTIAALGEIRITEHLVYEAPPAGPGHNPVNVLGLWSRTGNITIVGVLTPNDLFIDAAVLVPSGRFWVEGWDSIPVKGNVYFLGGTVQGTFGAFGGFSPDTGYGRVMAYDWRLRSNVSPPFFPPTDIFTAIRWPSPDPTFQNGDPLYERPQWEELAGF